MFNKTMDALLIRTENVTYEHFQILDLPYIKKYFVANMARHADFTTQYLRIWIFTFLACKRWFAPTIANSYIIHCATIFTIKLMAAWVDLTGIENPQIQSSHVASL
jgi:hypothetical protein